MDGLSEKGSGLYDWFSRQPLEVLPCLHKNFTEYHQTHPLCTPAAFLFHIHVALCNQVKIPQNPLLNWKGRWCYDRMLHRMAVSFVPTLHVCLSSLQVRLLLPSVWLNRPAALTPPPSRPQLSCRLVEHTTLWMEARSGSGEDTGAHTQSWCSERRHKGAAAYNLRCRSW